MSQIAQFLICSIVFCFWGEVEPRSTNFTEGITESLRKASKLRVYPQKISISGARDQQTIVAQLLFSDGLTQDASGQLIVTVQDEGVAKFDNGFFKGIQNGNTTANVKVDSFEMSIPISVDRIESNPPISFKNELVPILSKVGCNAGSCHGAARGKDGFQLSLYGYDPDGDYFRLTREMPGRRIDLALPEDCLLVSKATGEVAHTGGGLVKKESRNYRTLMRWLTEGAKADTGVIPVVDRVELFPPNGVLGTQGDHQQMCVVAHYSDGTSRDVTWLSSFLTNNDNCADVDNSGLIKTKNRGEAFVTARFDTHTVGADFVIVPKDEAFKWRDEAENNFIDRLTNRKLKKLRVHPSGLCSDQEFIRRVSLDICGVVPTENEVADFCKSQDVSKRESLVDDLLRRKEFIDIWVMKWSEMLQIRSLQNRVSYKAALLYYTWLQEKMVAGVPIDEMVVDLLSAQGGTFSNASTNYYQNEQDKLKVAENVAQVFMGVRIQCAQCHNHPFDRWTMDDYYSFAAFFSQLGRKRGEDPRETIIYNRGRGETKHPVTGQNMKPKFLGGDYPDTNRKDRRAVLANWLVSKENPYFSRHLANSIWAHFFGRGIVHEIDDVRISNPAVNQDLLDELGQRLAGYDYDFKSLVKDICNSRTYQRSTSTNETNEADLTNFSHANLRRIRAEILLDVISQITETKNKFKGLPIGARAVQIADGNTSTYFLSTFGRSKRETVCSCEVKAEPNLSQALHLINGDTINRKIKQGGVVKRWIDQGLTDTEIINKIYLRCFSRQANENEIENLVAGMDGDVDRKKNLHDIFWAVLNSQEFVFNH